MSESNGNRPRIKLSSLFITFPDPLSFSDSAKSLKSPFDHKKSPRNFEGEVVGLGIVAAMNENGDTQEAFSGAISTRTAKSVVSPRSAPIPIVSGNAVSKTETPMSELSESYTCVKMNGMDGNYEGKSGGFHLSQPKQLYVAEPVNDFLNTCYLCKKDLHGLDIFMYRGDKAFCSAECRCQQIQGDELRENCASEALKSHDFSASPCSAPRIFSVGVVAA